MQQAVDMYETAAAPLGSFPAIFSQATSLGLLSKRRMYHEAQKLLESQGGSVVPLIGECRMPLASSLILSWQSTGNADCPA